MPQLMLTDDRDREIATRSGRSLTAFLRSRRASEDSFLLTATGDGQHKTVAIPSSTASFLADILERLGAGQQVLVESLETELSTQEAADLLQVSRPFLIDRLLDTGRIPFHRVGTHRRVRLSDVLAYKHEREERRKASLRELAEEAQSRGMGYE